MQGGLIACQLDQFLSTYHLLEIKVVSFDMNVQGYFFFFLNFITNSFWKQWLERWL